MCVHVSLLREGDCVHVRVSLLREWYCVHVRKCHYCVQGHCVGLHAYHCCVSGIAWVCVRIIIV